MTRIFNFQFSVFKSWVLKSLLNPFLVITAASLLRLAPHEPNVAPISAMALFGGAYLSRKSALIFPILAMVASDLFLGFHDTIGWVYVSFLLIALMGMALKNRTNFRNIVLATLGGSVLFYLITNFGVWYSTPLYSKDLGGLMNSYLMAIPFFRNTLMGDLFFSGLFFGAYELLKSKSLNYLLAHSQSGR